ncbi:unnamed protein product [Taenia asiatica]|uniref:Cilia- and flagella-associated protein 157 n=1 Tax=Taenia asiatica TaxID=60517 RepID=A0A0R3VVD4_TAEAS|nr:unnamed protein product [Taenia asiatica]
MREDVELRLAEFIKNFDHLKGEQEHLIEEAMHAFTEKIKFKSTQIRNLQTELQLAKEKVKEDTLEKTLLENQSVVIDDLTAEVESLRTTNTDLDNELKRVNFAHSEEMRRLRDKMATMERDFTERINCLERQVDEGRETEKVNACFKDIAQVVEDLKTVKLNMESQQNFFKEAVTQMQSRQEDVLRQMEDNYQNSTKDLAKIIQEEDQRMQRLREELGLCDDLENRWRERIKDSLLGNVDESVLSTGIRFHLEETITALQATVSCANLALLLLSSNFEVSRLQLRGVVTRHVIHYLKCLCLATRINACLNILIPCMMELCKQIPCGSANLL